MATSPDNVSMALFCDFENVALGVRDANYDKFDIKRVLERLLLKGSIVVKKAYCDWERYKGFKATMHEANFELIEIPHVRQSGKNSADIRLVVDALDLCYTKSHVNTFVIISGDSDFSPLVSKLRENAKYVIGVGVKQSTSDLLIANCDEFIFYDDLVRESQRAAARREPRDAQPAARRTPEEDRSRRDENDKRRSKGVDIAVETFEALISERGDGGKMWASVLKEAIKRRNPGFSEQYYGFRTFGNLLEEAKARGLIEFGRDEKSGAYVYRSSGSAARSELAGAPEASTARQAESGRNGQPVPSGNQQDQAAPAGGTSRGRGRGRDRDQSRDQDREPERDQPRDQDRHARLTHHDEAQADAPDVNDLADLPEDTDAEQDEFNAPAQAEAPREDRGDSRRRGRGGRAQGEQGGARRNEHASGQARGRGGRQTERTPQQDAPIQATLVATPAPTLVPAVAPTFVPAFSPAPTQVVAASEPQAVNEAPAKAAKAARTGARTAPAKRAPSRKTATTTEAPVAAPAGEEAPAARKAAPRARRPRKAADDAA
jgi:uncharacterized LabA/DUF88 family protein